MYNISPETIEKIRHDYLNENLSEKQIIDKHNITIKVFNRIRKQNNIPKRLYKWVDRSKTIKFNDHYFENIDSENKAYWLGFITADGGFRNSKGSLQTLSIEISQIDIDHLEKFKHDLNSEHSIRKRSRFDKRTGNTYYGCSINISNRKFVNDLKIHGVTINKSKILKLPDLSSNLMRHYLRGLVDGDGCWHISQHNNQMVFEIVNPVKSFIEELINYFSFKCDLNKDIKIIETSGAFVFKYGGNIQCKRIFEYLYEDCNIYLDRKYELCENWFNNK